MKEIGKILACVGVILLLMIPTTILNEASEKRIISQNNLGQNDMGYRNKSLSIFDDKLDQYMDVPGEGDNEFGWGIGGPYYAIQTFRPTLPILTRVELYLKPVDSPPPITVKIKSPAGLLLGTAKSSAEVDFGEDFVSEASWVEFDFPDIKVIPGATYIIECTAPGGSKDNLAWWFGNAQSSYTRGMGVVFSPEIPILTFPGLDFCFKTYGMKEEEEEPPSITEVRSYYQGFFLDNYRIDNTYTVTQISTPPGTRVKYVEFDMNGDKYVDNNPLDGWKSKEYDMSKVGLNPTLTITAYSSKGVASEPYIIKPEIVDVPDWLQSVIELFELKSGKLIKTKSPEKEFDNIWYLKGSIKIPEPKVEGYVNVPLPVVGGKYGAEASSSFSLEISSDKKITLSGKGEAAFTAKGKKSSIDIELTGVLRIGEGTVEWVECTLTLNGDVTLPLVSLDWMIPYIKVGLEINLDITPHFDLTFTIVPHEHGTEIVPGVKLAFEKVTGEVGIKIQMTVGLGIGVASAEGTGWGDASLKLKVPPPYYDGFTLKAGLRVEYTICWIWGGTWEKEWEYPSQSLYLEGDDGNDVNWTIIARDYDVPGYNTYTWIAGRNKGTVVKNIFPNAHPSLATYGNGNKMMVYTYDDLEKELGKGMELCYMIWEEGTNTWSTPLPITDDNNPQTGAHLIRDGKGNIMCVFNQIDGDYVSPDVQPLEAFSHVELAYAIWDSTNGVWSAPTPITDNQMIDTSPALASDEYGNIMLVWLSDEDNDVFTVDDVKVYSCIWDGESWSLPTLVAEDIPIVSPPSLAYENGEAVCVFSVDEDGNLSTLDDREIYSVRYQENWQSLQRLTNDDKMDTSPYVCYYKGAPTVVWIKNNVSINDSFTNALYYATIMDGTLDNSVVVATGIVDEPRLLVKDKPIVVWQSGINGVPAYAQYKDGNWEKVISGVPDPDVKHRQISWISDNGHVAFAAITKPNASNGKGCNLIYVAEEDMDSPVTICTLSGDKQDGWYSSEVTVTLTATDSESPVNYTSYQIDNGQWMLYKGPVVITEEGKHTIRFYSVDIAGHQESEKSKTFQLWYENHPPEQPARPCGWIYGKPGKNYTYITSANDEDDDLLYYRFDWGDGTDSGWQGPFLSGEKAEISHSWEEKGVYEIKVKAMDMYGAESDWSDSLSISMPKVYRISVMLEKLNSWFMQVTGRKIMPGISSP